MKLLLLSVQGKDCHRHLSASSYVKIPLKESDNTRYSDM